MYGVAEDWIPSNRGGGWNGVLRVAGTDTSKALSNAESLTYFSLGMC